MLSGPFRLPSVSLRRLTQQIPSAHVLRIRTKDDRKVCFRLWMHHHQQTDTMSLAYCCSSPRMHHCWSPGQAMATGPLGWCVLGAGEAPLNRADTLNINCWPVKQRLAKNVQPNTHIRKTHPKKKP